MGFGQMPRSQKHASRLHSKNPADAAWRAQQAQVDADIEGLARDPELDRQVAALRAQGLGPRERIREIVNQARAKWGRKAGS